MTTLIVSDTLPPRLISTTEVVLEVRQEILSLCHDHFPGREMAPVQSVRWAGRGACRSETPNAAPRAPVSGSRPPAGVVLRLAGVRGAVAALIQAIRLSVSCSSLLVQAKPVPSERDQFKGWWVSIWPRNESSGREPVFDLMPSELGTITPETVSQSEFQGSPADLDLYARPRAAEVTISIRPANPDAVDPTPVAPSCHAHRPALLRRLVSFGAADGHPSQDHRATDTRGFSKPFGAVCCALSRTLHLPARGRQPLHTWTVSSTCLDTPGEPPSAGRGDGRNLG